MRGFGDKPGGEGVGGLPEPGVAGVGGGQPLIERQASDGLEGGNNLLLLYAAACSSSCSCSPTRNTAALRAAALAVKIARLSFFNTFNQFLI